MGVRDHGKWPSQSQGRLGEWMRIQRHSFVRNDEQYMKYRAPRLDEVGFEWTPRGNTKIKWDKGLELLLEFRRSNGHFIVPNPKTTAMEARMEEGDPPAAVDAKSEEYRLYMWVNSLHRMYRQYTRGRQSGSL